MTFQDEKEGHRRRNPDSKAETPDDRPASRKRRPPAAEFGQALKTVYQRTVDEDIPPEMLDLLGKLG